MTSSNRKVSYVDGYDGAPFAHEIPDEIEEYLAYVENGGKAFCEDQRKFVKLVRSVFANEDVYVHTDQLQKYLAMQRYFPYDLFAWEKCVLALHMCTYRVADNTPRWDDLFVLVGRGSGKNGYLAFEDFCALSPYNGIREYNIDICATNEDQAKTSFDDIWHVLDDNADRLRKHYVWTKEYITNRATGSTLRFRTNSPRGKDGLRSGKVDFDEVHEYENFKNIEVFTTGFGKKPHPRRTFITTNGFVRDGVLDSYLKRSEDILNGVVPDEGWLPFICRLDAEDEVDDKAMWDKANPSLEYLPHLQREIEKEYGAYQRGESSLSFLTKRMNIPKTDRELHITEWDNIKAANVPLPDLDGESCVIGLDYASISDMVGAGALFHGRDGMRYWMPHAWICRRSVDWGRIKAPLEEWAQAGLLTIVDDVEISPDLIAGWVEQMAQTYNVRRIAMDNFRFQLLKRSLQSVGFYADGPNGKQLFLARKTGEMKVAPVVESIFARHQIAWGENPLMNWAANNTMLVRNDKDGNMTFGKIEARSRKNDPFMALVAALQIEDDLNDAMTADIDDIMVL